MVRAVSPCAAIPQARKAISTTAANGLSDHDPNELTTDVVTGSRSSPATIAAGSGCASVAATALRITSAPTLSSATQIARGTCCPATRVSSAADTQASKPMKTQPPTASAASRPAAVDPPERASAPSVSVRIERSCSRKTSSSASPTPTEATTSAATPAFTARLSTPMPNAPAAAQISTSTIPVITNASAVTSMPSRVSAQGAPRYAIVVFATA